MDMTREYAELLLFAIKAGRSAAKQISLAKLDDLPDDLRAELEAERDELNSEWAALAPKR